MNKILLPLDKFYQFEKQFPDRPFLRQPIEGKWIEYTWKDVGREARLFANAIENLKLPPQSCIAILSKNCAHWIIADLAIWMAGHISVPLYPTLNSESIEYVLNHCGAKLLIAGKLDEWGLQKIGVPKDTQVVSFPFWQNEDTSSWKNFIKDATPKQNNHQSKPEEISTIIYTSGTTGKPKGAVHTFQSLSAHARLAIELIDLRHNDRFFSYLPLSHVAERLLVELGSLYCGGTVSFAESIESFKKNIKEVRPTIFLAVPRIWLKFQQGVLHKMPKEKLAFVLSIPILNSFVKKKINKEMGLDQVRFSFCGAAAISKDLLVWFDKLGIQIHEVYGMTENFGITSFNLPGKVKFGTVGSVWPNTKVMISSEGEILAKSEANMMGYYKEPIQTAEMIDEQGWLHSGDKGELGEDGYLRITGRIKDLFKTTKGKYVSPTQLEEFFTTCNLVEQVCVLGSGLSQPIALVILSDLGKKAEHGHIQKNISELLKFVNQKVDAHERLDHIVILKDEWSVENGILTPTLKIKRNVVEKMYDVKINGWIQTKKAVILNA